jgi:HK97 gp10 family phage protein
MGMTIDGADELMAAIDAIVSEDGPKGINAALRKATRKAVKEIVLPAVKDAIPVDSGFLEDNLQVRAIKRARGRVGHSVGFPDPLFQGDTFYAGFLEFGFKHRHGFGVPADSFLRRSLYENEQAVVNQVAAEVRQWVNDRNQESSG